MPRIILILLLLGLLLYGFYWFRRMSPEQKKYWLMRLFVFSGLLLLVGLALSGRLSWIFAAVGAILPVLPRLFRFFIGTWPSLLPFLRRYQQNKHSKMQGQFVRLQIDMLSGELQGEILKGKYAGQKLRALSLEVLLEVLQEAQEDSQSVSLITAYLGRVYPEWAESSGQGQHYEGSRQSPGAQSDMSAQQARDILGVDAKAEKDDINQAHKRLMQKLHPDRGGSDYLAQQINRARDVLLEELS